MASKQSKRFRKAQELVTNGVKYSISDALKIVSDYSASCATKCNESLEMVVKLGIDATKSDQLVRGVVQMPNGLGKSVRVAVVTNETRLDEAKKAGADVYGAAELIEKIKDGFLEFDICIATADVMPNLSKSAAKVLGPKGLMPNPKLGTVTDDITNAVKNAKAGQVEFRSDKAGIIHAAVGKIAFDSSALQGNIKALYDALVHAKPATSKGVYIKDIYLAPTMGPSIAVDISGLVG